MWREDSKLDLSSTVVDPNSPFDPEKLRAYELERLKYYYAVVECDTKETALSIYNQCDGSEFERTSNKIDLRFIPEGTPITNKPRYVFCSMHLAAAAVAAMLLTVGYPGSEVANEAPSNYEAPDWATKALQHTKVDLSWDADDHQRKTKLSAQKFTKDQLRDMDFRAYLANSSESSDDEEDEEAELDPSVLQSVPVITMPGGETYDVAGKAAKERKKRKQEESRERFKQLLAGLESQQNQHGEDMEITFTPGFSEVGRNMEEKKQKLQQTESASVYEQYLERKREKKRERRRAKRQADEEEGGMS